MENNNQTEIIYCPACGAENRADYAFCLKCGSPLKATAAQEAPFTAPQYSEIGGVPEREVSDYIGASNNFAVMKKFKRLSDGSNACWNWPVFILGLFNMQFVWFFYRKMYKLGALLLALSVFITGVNIAAVATAFDAVSGPISEIIYNLFETVQTGGEYVLNDQQIYDLSREILGQLGKAFSGSLAWMYIAVQIMSVIKIVMLIVTPIFADKAHYGRTIRDITEINRGNVTVEAVKAAGRPNTVAAVLSGVLFCIAYIVAVTVPVIIIMNSIIDSVSVML